MGLSRFLSVLLQNSQEDLYSLPSQTLNKVSHSLIRKMSTPLSLQVDIVEANYEANLHDICIITVGLYCVTHISFKVISQISGDSSATSVTRRSAGLPLIVQSLVSAESKTRQVAWTRSFVRNNCDGFVMSGTGSF